MAVAKRLEKRRAKSRIASNLENFHVWASKEKSTARKQVDRNTRMVGAMIKEEFKEEHEITIEYGKRKIHVKNAEGRFAWRRRLSEVTHGPCRTWTTRASKETRRGLRCGLSHLRMKDGGQRIRQDPKEDPPMELRHQLLLTAPTTQMTCNLLIQALTSHLRKPEQMNLPMLRALAFLPQPHLLKKLAFTSALGTCSWWPDTTV